MRWSLVLASVFLPLPALAQAVYDCDVEPPHGTGVVHAVAKARPERVSEAEAFNDCCTLCAHQTLEALAPPAPGSHKPRTREGGGLPLRRQFCGPVTRYGVNNEVDDPRDIMINIRPAPGYESYLAGFVNTEDTPLEGSLREKYGCYFTAAAGCSDATCDEQACLRDAQGVRFKAIHAEITPPQEFYGEDHVYLPIDGDGYCAGGHSKWGCRSALEIQGDQGNSQKTNPNPGEDVCVYGVYALDHGDHRNSVHREFCCSRDIGHDRPEIHPFDAIWWKKSSETWMFAVFQDDSNRYSFPHCGDEHNGNTWSQAPRDVTFSFPFRLDRSKGPYSACLSHVVTRNFDGETRPVLPINVSTEGYPEGALAERKRLSSPGSVLLEVVEPEFNEQETQVRVEGCATASEIKGYVKVRVAVGCDPRGDCSGKLVRSGMQVGPVRVGGNRIISKDLGSGLYYGQLDFKPGLGSCNGGGADTGPGLCAGGSPRLCAAISIISTYAL